MENCYRSGPLSQQMELWYFIALVSNEGSGEHVRTKSIAVDKDQYGDILPRWIR